MTALCRKRIVQTFFDGAILLFLLATTPLPARALPVDDRVPGGIAVIPLADMTRPEVYLEQQRVLVIGSPGRWHAVAGIGLDVAPGEFSVQVGKPGTARRISLKVLPRDYPTQHIQIQDQRKVEPLPGDLQRIELETARMAAVKAQWTELEDPALDLRQPVAGEISGNYGLRRIFNGQPRQPHGGMDIVAPKGTTVTAAAAGRVALVGDFFFNGNTVFIDHGQRLLTMYCHLDRVQVKPGETLVAGTPIGAVGQTGRATGPHLHWGVYLNGTAVNPQLLLSATAPRGAGQARPATDATSR